MDGVWVDAIEMHCHGSACTEGVTADIAFGIAECVEADGARSLLEGGADVLGRDGVPTCVEWVGIMEETSGVGAIVAEDVLDSRSE